jgi:hypothetical protein
VAAIEKSRLPPDPGKDAIRPVYPVEILLGIGAVGIAGGVTAAVRAAGGAILRQMLPKAGPRTGRAGDDSAEGVASAEKPTSPTRSGASKPGEENSLSPAERPAISRQKQAGHIRGTPQNRNRLKQRARTSTFDGDGAQADVMTYEAWEKGTPMKGRPNVRNYDYGRRIGEGPKGESQSTVRVHQDSAGRIHGHPVGRETQ